MLYNVLDSMTAAEARTVSRAYRALALQGLAAQPGTPPPGPREWLQGLASLSYVCVFSALVQFLPRMAALSFKTESQSQNTVSQS